MRVNKRFIVLVIVATSALAGYEMFVHTSDSNDATKLVSSDASLASPAIGTFHPDRTRSLRNVNTLTAHTTEERAAKTLPAGWEANLAEMAKGSLVARRFFMKPERAQMRWAQSIRRLSESRKQELKQVVTRFYEEGMPVKTILKRLRKEQNALAHGEYQFVYILFNTLYKEALVKAKATVDECLRQGLSKANTIEMVRGGRKMLRNDEMKFVVEYYGEQFDAIVNKEVSRYLAQGLSAEDILAAMKMRYEEIHTRGWLKKIKSLCDLLKQVEGFKKVVEYHLVHGRTPDGIQMGLKAASLNWTSQQTQAVDICIKEWFEKNDAEMYKILQDWVARGESSSIVVELVRAHELDPLKSLNTRDPSNFIQMTYDPQDQVQATFMKLLQANLQPFELGQNLEAHFGIGCSMKYFTMYADLYKKAEVDLVRILATWWQQNVTPDEVAERLKLLGLVHGDSMKKEFHFMYERAWKRRWQPSLRAVLDAEI